MRLKGCLNLRRPSGLLRRESWLFYSGPVREKDGAILFLGSIREEPGDIFILNVKPVLPGASSVFAGISTSPRADAISARRFALERVAKPVSIFKLAKICGMIDLDGPEVAAWVRSAITSIAGDDPPLCWNPKKRAASPTSEKLS